MPHRPFGRTRGRLQPWLRLSAISYNSCRNRHCPKCQSLKQAKWLAERLERLLPTHYFHLVVTLPHELQPLARCNPELIFNLLFEAVSRALLQLARTMSVLRAQIGLYRGPAHLGSGPQLPSPSAPGGNRRRAQ